MQIDKWWGDNIHPANLLQRIHMHESMESLLSLKLDIVIEYIDVHNFEVPDYDYSVHAPISARFISEAVATALVKERNQHDTVTRANACQEAAKTAVKGFKDQARAGYGYP